MGLIMGTLTIRTEFIEEALNGDKRVSKLSKDALRSRLGLLR